MFDTCIAPSPLLCRAADAPAAEEPFDADGRAWLAHLAEVCADSTCDPSRA